MNHKTVKKRIKIKKGHPTVKWGGSGEEHLGYILIGSVNSGKSKYMEGNKMIDLCEYDRVYYEANGTYYLCKKGEEKKKVDIDTVENELTHNREMNLKIIKISKEQVEIMLNAPRYFENEELIKKCFDEYLEYGIVKADEKTGEVIL